MGKSLQSALTAMKKKYGETSVFQGNENVVVEVETISTGSLALDAALLSGGYPKGRIIQISGAESSGKTFLCLMAIKKAQQAGLTCAFIDAEHTLDRKWCTQLGIDYDALIITQPDWFEEALQQISILAKTGEVGLIVWDSVPCLDSKMNEKKDIGEIGVGQHARVLSSSLKRLTPILHRNGTILLAINQLREKVGVMYGNPETTPGGRALKHACSVHVEVAKVSRSMISDDLGRDMGHRIRARVKKNKISTAQGIQVDFLIRYLDGIDYIDEICSVGVQCGVIERPNNKTYIIDGVKISGKDNIPAYLNNSPDVAKKLETDILAAMRKGVKVAKPVEGDSDEVEEISELEEDSEFLSMEE